MRPKVGFPLRSFSFVFNEVCETFVPFSAAAEAIVRLSREKAALRASGFAYWRESRSGCLLKRRQRSFGSRSKVCVLFGSESCYDCMQVFQLTHFIDSGIGYGEVP